VLTNIDNLLSALDGNPYHLESRYFYREREAEKIQKLQQSSGTIKAVVIFMVDDFQFFEGMLKYKIKKIAFKIAMYGRQGYRPGKDDYRFSSIKRKIFSCCHILTHHNDNWAIAIPEIQLQYDDKYNLAFTIHKPIK